MSENQAVWINWARALQHWGINQEVASLLEVAGSYSVLFAQLLYLSQPLLSSIIAPRSLASLAQALENTSDRREFISILKEGNIHAPAA